MKTTIRKVWALLPGRLRLRMVRSVQRKFTVSAAVFVIEGGRVLLLDHVFRPFSGWGLPGGFVSHGEQPHDAIRRELKEEVGLELDDLKMYRIRTINKHIEILFTARPRGEATVRSREVMGFEWFGRDELPEDIGRAQRELIRKVLDNAD